MKWKSKEKDMHNEEEDADNDNDADADKRRMWKSTHARRQTVEPTQPKIHGKTTEKNEIEYIYWKMT